MQEKFWLSIDTFVEQCKLVVDRPAGSAHPRYPDFIYPYDYGYLEGTLAMDQGGIDVWRGSLPHTQVSAVICTVDLKKKDAEIKLLVGCTRAEAESILAIHNGGSQSGLLIIRERED